MYIRLCRELEAERLGLNPSSSAYYWLISNNPMTQLLCPDPSCAQTPWPLSSPVLGPMPVSCSRDHMSPAAGMSVSRLPHWKLHSVCPMLPMSHVHLMSASSFVSYLRADTMSSTCVVFSVAPKWSAGHRVDAQ